jgi:hypothetical protein
MTQIVIDSYGLKNPYKSGLSLFNGIFASSACHVRASFFTICLLLLFWLPFPIFGQTTTTSSLKSQNGFIENKGQIIDQHSQPNQKVLYLLNTSGMNIQLRKGGWSYDIYSVKYEEPRIACYEFHRIDFDLIDCNPNYEIITSEPSLDYLNYYTAGTPVEGTTFVRSYQSVIYKNIYPNIDLECLVDPVKGYKYNWIIYPGGELSSVKLKISSPDITVTQEGSLELVTEIAKIEEKIPNSFTFLNNTKSPVEIDFYEISPGIYGFTSNRMLPKNATLMIDPIPDRIWGTYYGGSG